MRLPDVSIPCPQGVQGDDCVRFKLWLENCQRFNLHDCVEQLQGFQSGRVTLAQIFAQQDAMIKDVSLAFFAGKDLLGNVHEKRIKYFLRYCND